MCNELWSFLPVCMCKFMYKQVTSSCTHLKKNSIGFFFNLALKCRFCKITMKTPAQKENDLYRFYFWNGCKKQTLDRKVITDFTYFLCS